MYSEVTSKNDLIKGKIILRLKWVYVYPKYCVLHCCWAEKSDLYKKSSNI